MNFVHRFRILIFILGGAVLGALGPVAPAFSQERPYLIDLDTRTMTELEGLGGGYTLPYDINDAGQVVGVSSTSTGAHHAFITGPDGVGIRDMGTLGGDYSSAHGINSLGQVVGESYTSSNFRSHAFITGPDGSDMRKLGVIGDERYAYAINDAGQVAGEIYTSAEYYRAYVTGPNGAGMTILGTLGGVFSWSGDINATGQVTGYSYTEGKTPEGVYHGFITNPNSGDMKDLGALGGKFSRSTGVAINDEGQVAGYSDTPDGTYHAFITDPNGEGMRDIGHLGGNFSVALDLNEAGEVVGKSHTQALGYPDGQVRAFITHQDGYDMTDLNSLVNVPDGLVLTEALGINNNRQIVAIAQVIPEPQIYIMLLAGLGLVAFMVRRKAA